MSRIFLSLRGKCAAPGRKRAALRIFRDAQTNSRRGNKAVHGAPAPSGRSGQKGFAIAKCRRICAHVLRKPRHADAIRPPVPHKPRRAAGDATRPPVPHEPRRAAGDAICAPAPDKPSGGRSVCIRRFCLFRAAAQLRCPLLRGISRLDRGWEPGRRPPPAAPRGSHPAD